MGVWLWRVITVLKDASVPWCRVSCWCWAAGTTGSRVKRETVVRHLRIWIGFFQNAKKGILTTSRRHFGRLLRRAETRSEIGAMWYLRTLSWYDYMASVAGEWNMKLSIGGMIRIGKSWNTGRKPYPVATSSTMNRT